MEHKIALIGCGTVGQGLLGILEDKKDHLRDAFGFEARVVAITDKLKGTLMVPEGIDIPAVLDLLGPSWTACGSPPSARGPPVPSPPGAWPGRSPR